MPELVRGGAQEGDHLPRELHLRWIRAGRKGQLSGWLALRCALNAVNRPISRIQYPFRRRRLITLIG